MGGGEQYRKDIPPLEIPCHLVTLPCTHVTAFQNEFKEHRIPPAIAKSIFKQELYQDPVNQEGMKTPDKKKRGIWPEFIAQQGINSGHIDGGKEINNPS
jgi:hypothetical protein